MPDVSKNGTIREILTGSGIAILIVFLSMLFPVASLTLPFPVFLYRMKLGRNHGARVPLLTLLAALVVSGGFSLDVAFISAQMLTGFLMGELFEKGFPVDKSVIYSCGMVLSAGTLGTLLFTVIDGRSPFSVLAAQITAGMDQLRQLNSGVNIPPEAIQTVSEFMAAYFPSIMMVALFISGCITFVIFRAYVKRKGSSHLVQISFKNWKTPEFFVWCVIASGLTLLLPVSDARIIGTNLLVIFMAVYLLQGLIIVSYYLDRFKFPRLLRTVLYFTILIQNFALIGAIGLGFFDMWFNFRKLGTENNK